MSRPLIAVLTLMLCVSLHTGCKQSAKSAAGGAPAPFGDYAKSSAPAPTSPAPAADQSETRSAAPAASAPAASTAPQQVAQATSTAVATSTGGNGTASDWPRFQGPYGNSLAPRQGMKTNWSQQPPPKLWQVAMGDNGFAGPAVARGKVYILDHRGSEDVVRCLDLLSGKEVWTYAYSDGGGDNYGFSRATPCIEGGKVYTISRSGIVNCLDAARGAKLWTRNLQGDLGGSAPQWLYAPSPVIDGNTLIVIPGGSRGAVAALDKNSGQTLWQGGGTDQCSYATPVVATINGVKQYVVFTAKSLSGVQASNGKQLWRVGWETGCDVNAATPLVAGNRIFITSGYNHGCALVEVSGSSARIVWQNKALQAHFSSPVLYNSRVYGIGDPGNLVCLEPGSGRVLWQQSGFEKGGLIVVDGMLMAFQGGTGVLVLAKADPSGYQEVGRFTPLGGQSWTAPVVADGKLVVRNKTALACFDLR